MKFFRYKEDRIPTLIIITLFLLDFLVYFYATNIYQLIIWFLITLWPKACICSWNHHHQHLPTFIQKIPNRLLEIVYALHTGITTNAWVLHHVLGHHANYLDQQKDESGWQRKDGSTMGAFEYTWTIAITGYLRAYQVGKRYPKNLKSFINMSLVVILLIALLVYLNWLNALIVYLIPMTVGYVITCWHTYYHHAGLDTEDHHHASYNIMHKYYNILTGNLGYHTAHHMKMGLHWSKLPEFHKEIAQKIPVEYFVEPCFPFTLLPAK